jgi:threonine/homoserine/homoserine lactone efflux protein
MGRTAHRVYVKRPVVEEATPVARRGAHTRRTLVLDRISGVVLIGLGTRLALERR